jgi:hypothetical protein
MASPAADEQQHGDQDGGERGGRDRHRCVGRKPGADEHPRDDRGDQGDAVRVRVAAPPRRAVVPGVGRRRRIRMRIARRPGRLDRALNGHRPP